MLAKQQGFCKVIVKLDSRETILCLHNSIENGNWEAFPILRKNILIREILSIIPLVLDSKINQHDDGSLGIA